MFSIGASKIANSARENVSRYGNIAGQKVFHSILQQLLSVWLPTFLKDLFSFFIFLLFKSVQFIYVNFLLK